jgi:phosphoribosylformylglycinamidine cyclo-ligase
MKTKKTGKRPPQQDVSTASGVNLDAGDVFSSFCGRLCRNSYNNSPFVRVTDWSEGQFRGPRGWEFIRLPRGSKNTGGSDGVGTKTILVVARGNFNEAAPNLGEMCGVDIARWGGIALLFFNVYETKSLGEPGSEKFKAHESVMYGLSDYSKRQNIVLFTGETAEMSACVSTEIRTSKITDGPVAFNWSGTMIGAIHRDRLINGASLRPGQRIIALGDGVRSNGISTIRKYLRESYGNYWWKHRDAKADIAEASEPAAEYTDFLARMNGWYAQDRKPLFKMHAIAHLTGGAFKDKFGGILFPRGLSAKLDNLFDPPNVVRKCVEAQGITDEKAHRYFGCGHGALVVLDKDESVEFCSQATAAGIAAQDVGEIQKTIGHHPRMSILSKFTGQEFSYRPE